MKLINIKKQAKKDIKQATKEYKLYKKQIGTILAKVMLGVSH